MSTTVGRATDTDTDAQKAAKEIADARERANAAADAYFASESRIDQLTLQQDQLQSEITALEGDVKALQLSVENVAIGRYTRSGSTGVPLLTVSNPLKIRSRSSSARGDLRLVGERLRSIRCAQRRPADKRLQLADKKDQAEKERVNLASLKDAASAEVQRLKDVEADRLKDEAVRTALIAEFAERASASSTARSCSALRPRQHRRRVDPVAGASSKRRRLR